MVLNLDPTFKPISGSEVTFEAFTFSGGEPHIKIQLFDTESKVTVTHRICSFNDLGLLLIAVDALKRMGCRSISAYIPYFPAARQDRVMTPGESLSVKVYTDVINSLGLDMVTVFDPHSEVTPALLDNCNVISNHTFIQSTIKDLPDDCYLTSPDAGAEKKIHKLAIHLQKYDVLECGKKRDVKTGALSGFKVPIADLKGRPCLIVDDICDGGGTFIGLAKKLKKANAGDLYLAVSHGIFSKGFDNLRTYFKTIYTTDSFRNIDEESIKQIKLSELT